MRLANHCGPCPCALEHSWCQARGDSRSRAIRHIPRIPPEDPLQLLGRQPATEASPRVPLRSLDERRTEALLQPFATLLISGSRSCLQVVHAVQSNGPRTPGARPMERSARCGAGGQVERTFLRDKVTVDDREFRPTPPGL
jgi:hypothetical protein